MTKLTLYLYKKFMTRFVLLDIPSIVDSIADEKVFTLDNYY
ncbi:MAG: hypothetical protein WCB31_00780 [Nitrososphaeraceae archaeon]